MTYFKAVNDFCGEFVKAEMKKRHDNIKSTIDSGALAISIIFKRDKETVMSDIRNCRMKKFVAYNAAMIKDDFDFLEQPKLAIQIPFRGVESEYQNLRSNNIRILNLELNDSTNGILEAKLQGTEHVLRTYISKLWKLNEDSPEINELFK